MPDDRRPDIGEWREGRHGFPVLVRLRDLELELGDRESRGGEPSPFTDELEAPDVEAHADWWAVPYKLGSGVKVPGFPRTLYPKDHAKGQSAPGSDVEAYKRAVCRLGRWAPWQSEGWSDDYIADFAHGRGTGGKVPDTGVSGVQRQQGIDDTGTLGEPTFEVLRKALVPVAPGFSHGGDPAFDSVCVNLLEQAWQTFNKPPADIADVRAAIADFCKRSIRAAGKWHYVQHRPMQYGAPPDDDSHDNDDCSEHATQSYFWARKVTGVAVPDPNPGNGYNGAGYTGTLVSNPTANSPYQVGDMAIYGTSTGNTTHVCTCYAKGDASSSEWCSNGSEEAPYAVELRYRSDLVKVVRPKLMP